VLVVAALARGALLASGTVSFHADEAVVGLMARHITQGARPVFFYGQAYMGSLDAWIVAAGFRLLGESVAAMRLVQSALYLLAVALGYTVAWRLSGRMTVAWVAGLMLAVPPVVGALYTTATLGGYNETLILGALILLLGYDVTRTGTPTLTRSAWRWMLWGPPRGRALGERDRRLPAAGRAVACGTERRLIPITCWRRRASACSLVDSFARTITPRYTSLKPPDREFARIGLPHPAG
jgi:hypothetical protein